MSRSIIAVIVAIVIAALTATAYFITTSNLSRKVEVDLEDRVERARDQLLQGAAIEGLGVLRKIESLSTSQRLVEALHAISKGTPPNWKEMKTEADLAFSEFMATEKDQQQKPDILALVDAKGDVLFQHGVAMPTAGEFKDPKTGAITLPALSLVLSANKKRVAVSEIARIPGVGLARIIVAPVIDHEASAVASAEAGEDRQVVAGAVLAAYAITAKAAQQQDRLLGVRVAYFDAGHVSATSFQRGQDEDTEMHGKLDKVIDQSGLKNLGDATATPLTRITLDGDEYLAAGVRMPRFLTIKADELPKDYPRQEAGAIVLVSAGEEAKELTKTAKIFILLLGVGALAIALIGMYLVHRRLEAQIDEIQLGVGEIINGNLDKTFQPVGSELDGLANALNVMLARLLGRPEPGEEAFDENGNPIIPGKVDFEEPPEELPAAPAPDPDLAALAQEPEPDYYKRVFTEYVEARKQTGSPDDVSFESFIAKLRVNEGKLKAKYDCKQVRFRVVVKDSKVTLKPVPIY